MKSVWNDYVYELIMIMAEVCDSLFYVWHNCDRMRCVISMISMIFSGRLPKDLSHVTTCKRLYFVGKRMEAGKYLGAAYCK